MRLLETLFQPSGELFGFLTAHEQSRLRGAGCRRLDDIFQHCVAYERGGVVAVAISRNGDGRWAPAAYPFGRWLGDPNATHVVVNIARLLAVLRFGVGPQSRGTALDDSHLPNNFCSGFPHVRSIVFREGSRVVTAGSGVFRGNKCLESVDLRTFTSLRTVGGSWLSECPRLRSVDFSALQWLTVVGDSWLANARCVTTVVFSGLPRLKVVGALWLSDCTALVAATFSDLPSLEVVGYSWLRRCVALQSATFENLPSLRCVDGHWMGDCEQLQRLVFGCVLLSAGSSIGGGLLRRAASSGPVVVVVNGATSTEDNSEAVERRIRTQLKVTSSEAGLWTRQQ